MYESTFRLQVKAKRGSKSALGEIKLRKEF